MPIGDLLPELVVLLTAVSGIVAASFLGRARQWLVAPLALVGVAVAFALCLLQLGEPPRLTFSGVWALDDASIWGRALILAATAVVVVLSPDWMRSDARHGEYYAIVLFSALGAMMLAAAADLLELVVGVLLSSVTGYTLAAYHRDWGPSVEAGMKYFLVGALANVLLVTGVTVLFGLFGVTGFSELAAGSAAAEPQVVLLTAVALVLAGLAFKAAAVPAHAWLPDVAQGAPAPAAAFLTVVPKIGALVALARLVEVLPVAVVPWPPLLATLAVATMTLGNVAALWQRDLRRLLGWSSVSQSGYALMAVTVVAASDQAVTALLFFLAGYAAANLTAFGVVTHLRGRTRIADYRGLGRRRPVMAAALVVALLSLVGIPPLAGFVGKLLLFLTSIDGGYGWLAVVAVANTVVSLFYYLRVIGPMYFDEPVGEVAVLGRWSLLGAATALAATAGLGVLAQILLGTIEGPPLLP